MSDGPLIRWDWITARTDQIWAATVEHLRLTVIAVVVGFLIAAALSAAAVRWRWTLGPITGVAGVIYTIPSLALFTILVPITGLATTLTAEIALVGYTLLVLIRNIVAGIDGVPRAVRDAADGMGYTPWRRFVDVEARLALPAVIAGVRLAMVTTVGLVTVTAIIGMGGYGTFIKRGLERRFLTEIALGGVLAVLLAATLDLLLVLLGRLLTPWTRKAAR